MAEAVLEGNKSTTGPWIGHWGSDCRAIQLLAGIAVNSGFAYDKNNSSGHISVRHTSPEPKFNTWNLLEYRRKE